jgi:hypothetical protein
VALGKGHFGTAFYWTVTSSKENKDGKKNKFPALRIHVIEDKNE